MKVARAGAAGAALANAPIFVAPTCAGTAGGAPQPGAVFRTGQDGTCSFTFEAAADALIGTSPLFIGLGSLPTGESWVRVNLEIIPPAPPEETTSAAARGGALELAAVAASSAGSGAARAVFPALVKLADLPVPANRVPWKINDRGQVAYLNYSQNGLLIWNGGSLVTVPQAYPGFLYVRDLNSAGKLVGELQRLNSDYLRTTWAFHADIGARRLSILQPDVPDLYRSVETLSSGAWIPTRWFNALNSSTFSHIAESGTAWGTRDGFQNVASTSVFASERNYVTEKFAGIPSAYQTSSGAWSTLPGNSAAFRNYQSDTYIVGPFGAISVPSVISPDASHWLLSSGSSSATAGGGISSVTRLEARPDIRLPAQLPGAVAGITDAGDIAGSGAYSTYDPYFLRNGTLVRFGAVDQVLGLANRELTEPAMVLGKKGVWLQRTDPATGLPQPLAKGANAFEYRTYQDLGASLALANLEALVVSKQGNTVVLAGTNAQGLVAHVTASLLLIDIEEVISDQFAGIEVNNLPSPFFGGVPTPPDPTNPCAGGTGDGNNPMLMGTRSDGKAHLKTRVNIGGLSANYIPDNLLVGLRVVDKDRIPLEAETRVAVKPSPYPGQTEIVFTPLAQASDRLPYYETVFGWDENGDGKIQSGEVAGSFQKTPLIDRQGTPSTDYLELADLIIIATPTHVGYCVGEIDDTLWWSVHMKYTEDMVTSFITGDKTNVTSDSHVSETTGTVTANEPSDLSHPVGLNFDNSGTATTHQFNFDKDSELSGDAYESIGLKNFLVNIAVNKQQDIINAAPANPGESSYLLMGIPIGSSVCFPGDYSTYGIQPPTPESRLFFSLKKAAISGAVLLKISRYYNDASQTTQRLEISWDEIDSNLDDVYDFAYSTADLPRQGAIIQAGFTGTGTRGKPFRNHAVLKYNPDPQRILIINL